MVLFFGGFKMTITACHNFSFLHLSKGAGRFFKCLHPAGLLLALALFLGLGTSFGHAQSTSAERGYLLRPGDRLELSLPGISGQSWEATIDLTGRIRFPFIGRQVAAGMSLAELSRRTELAATGLEVQIFEAGARSIALLSGEEIYLRVVQYRPVTIIGDVLQPGSFDFVPGMTVRVLLGQAGGARLAELAGQQPPVDGTIRMQTALQTQKWLRAQVLRSQIMLDAPLENANVSLKDADRLRGYLGPEEGNTLISEIEISLRDRQFQHRDLKERIELISRRVADLGQAYQNYEKASLSEEERLQRMLAMGEKGLVTADRVTEARNSALASSTRLLTVSSDVYEAQAELQRLKERLARLDDTFKADILAEQRRFAQQLSETDARIDGYRQLYLTDANVADGEGYTSTRLTIHRGAGVGEVSVPARMGDLVYPGDVVEVTLQLIESN